MYIKDITLQDMPAIVCGISWAFVGDEIKIARAIGELFDCMQ